jgi:DNA-binding MarR family transcriptional regulator
MQKQFGIPDKELKQFLEPLLSKGYIRTDTPDTLTISESGTETIGKLWTIIDNAESKILNGFSENEKHELFRLIEKIKKNCSSIIDTTLKKNSKLK